MEELSKFEEEVVAEELERFLSVEQCDCNYNAASTNVVREGAKGATDNVGVDVVEEGGTPRNKNYRVRLGDGLGDKYELFAYNMGHAHMLCLTQEPTDTDVWYTGCQYLYLRPMQWKTLEQALPKLRSMLRFPSKNPDYKVNAYHVVGRLHADIELTPRGNTLILYQGYLDKTSHSVRRDIFCCVALDEQAVEGLMDQFPIVDREFPIICQTKPCYMMANHFDSLNALTCDQCNPF